MSNNEGTPRAESDSAASPSRPFSRMRKRRRQSSSGDPSTAAATRPPKFPTLFTVRPNPNHYVLDMSENSSSTERLVADAFTRNGVRCAAVAGLPGSGKTVILRAVAHDREIHRAFRDGVALLGLMEASPESLLKDLCEVVGRVCGMSVQVQIESMIVKRDYAVAMTLVANALIQRRMLLLFDSVDAIGSELFILVAKLVQVAQSKPGYLAVLISSRSLKVAKAIAEQTFFVKLLDPVGDLAKSILCAHAEFERSDFDAKCAVKDNSILPVLQKCSGLPLALAVAGGAVKRLLRSVPSEQAKIVIWAHYRKYLRNNFDQFGEISGLFRSFNACLNIIQESQEWPSGVKVDTALAALSRTKGDSRIPRALLQKLWKLESSKEVAGAMNCLVDLCLVESQNESDLGIQIPGIIFDYCRSLAMKMESGGDKVGALRNTSHAMAENGKKTASRGEPTSKGLAQRQTRRKSAGERIQA